MKQKKYLFLLTALIFSAVFTACGQNVSGGSEAGNTAGTTPAASQSQAQTVTAAQTETDETTQSEAKPEQEIVYDSEKHTEIFSSELKAGGETYEVRAFAYDRMEKSDDNTVKGDLAVELSKNGERINTLVPIMGYLGQYPKSYAKDNFEVIKLDGGEILAATYYESANNENALEISCFFSITDGKLGLMERYYTEEEKKQLESEDPHGHPITEKTCFNTTGSFKQNENTLTFTLDKDMTKNETVYPAGEITLKFDFENNTVQCEKKEYKDLVYYY